MLWEWYIQYGLAHWKWMAREQKLDYAHLFGEKCGLDKGGILLWREHECEMLCASV